MSFVDMFSNIRSWAFDRLDGALSMTIGKALGFIIGQSSKQMHPPRAINSDKFVYMDYVKCSVQDHDAWREAYKEVTGYSSYHYNPLSNDEEIYLPIPYIKNLYGHIVGRAVNDYIIKLDRSSKDIFNEKTKTNWDCVLTSRVEQVDPIEAIARLTEREEQ